MKKILPWLLLLLLLIIYCVWTKKDSIQISSSTLVHKQSSQQVLQPLNHITYTIKQEKIEYTLNGNFVSTQDQSSLSKLFDMHKKVLRIQNTSSNKTLISGEALRLTEKILPHFIENYSNGRIGYHNETLHISGNVSSYAAKNKMQSLLSSSLLASQNDTNVVLPKKAIGFTITHTQTSDTLKGDFTDQAQQDSLQKTFDSQHKSLKLAHISKDEKRYDAGGIALTSKILPLFLQEYTQGEIHYGNDILTISGLAKSPLVKTQMDSLLHAAKIHTKNLTQVDEVYLEKLAKLVALEKQKVKQTALLKAQASAKLAQKQAEDKAKKDALAAKKATLAKENKLQQERLRQEKLKEETLAQEKLAKIKAEKDALEAEKAIQKATRAKEAKLEQERLRQEKLDEEKRLQASVQAQQAKNNISTLLKLENIEFEVSKGSLTAKGKSTVMKLANILKQYPSINIEIAGHTDADGSASFNQKLSQSRVDTVKSTLIVQGVIGQRLTAKGYGESKPLVPNTTNDNKQKNRRVEINILGE